MGPTATVLQALLMAIADEPGRGDDPGGVGGVLIVVGIAVLLLLIAGAALLLVSRVVRSRRNPGAQATHTRLPSEEGRPWSSQR